MPHQVDMCSPKNYRQNIPNSDYVSESNSLGDMKSVYCETFEHQYLEELILEGLTMVA